MPYLDELEAKWKAAIATCQRDADRAAMNALYAVEGVLLTMPCGTCGHEYGEHKHTRGPCGHLERHFRPHFAKWCDCAGFVPRDDR